MVGTELFDVPIATDYHNEDLVSVEPRQGIVVVNNGSTSTSYMEVNETPIEDYGQDVFELDAALLMVYLRTMLNRSTRHSLTFPVISKEILSTM